MSALDTCPSHASAGLAGSALPSTGANGTVAHGKVSLWQVMRRMWIAAMTRRELAQMDEHMLRDLGLSRADVARETARAPWDTAPTRRGDREI